MPGYLVPLESLSIQKYSSLPLCKESEMHITKMDVDSVKKCLTPL